MGRGTVRRLLGGTGGALVACVVLIIASSSSGGEKGAKAKVAPTYTKDVAPILYRHCASCARNTMLARSYR